MKRILAVLVAVATLVLVSHCGGSSGGTPPPDSGTQNGFTLSIDNYLAWCVVTVDSGPLNASATYIFDAGTVVDLHAVGAPTFTFSRWTNTSANTANSTTVTMNSNVNVRVCCDHLPNETCPF